VSVCIPTFNRKEYIGEAIESVLDQSFGDLELVISDNASTDATAEVACSFNDKRVRYRRNESNVGGPANWVRALAAARGRYFVIVGDDDRWSPTFLERLVAPLEACSEVDVTFCDHWVIDAQGQVLRELSDRYSESYGRAALRPGRQEDLLELALHSQALLTTAALIRRDRVLALEALDARAGRVLDYYLFALLALAGGAAYYVPERLAYYRVHARSGSSLNQVEVWRDMRWVCERLIEKIPEGRHARKIRARRARAMASEGAARLRQGDRSGALRSFGRAVRAAPHRVRPWLGLAAATLLRRWPPFGGPNGSGLLSRRG
jgi:glycosyltransferase involved in cell wall biosynthesis